VTRDPRPEDGVWATRSGIHLDALYDHASMARAGVEDLDRWVGVPGAPPFTRGIDPGGYRQEPWIMGQYSGFGSAEETNLRLRHLFEQGQTGFSVALDLPTQMGLDSDHPLARGEVGKVGVAIDALPDMERLFAGIPLGEVRQLRTTANAIGPIWLALVVALAEKQRVDPNSIRILIQNDVLKEYFARGTYIVPPRPAVEMVVDTIEYCAHHLPAWTPLAMSGYHIRESGASASQELAFTFANGLAYCQGAMARGVPAEQFLPSLFTFLSAGTDLLEEVAKFRAARRVWADLVETKLGVSDHDSRALRIFGFSAGSSLTAQQPLNNVVRVTLCALAAILGGVQTLHTASFDEALATPTERAATLALRTQQILSEESGLRGTVDALGGSWAVETLTALTEARVWALLRDIDDRGGAVACVESGWFGEQVSDGAYEDQQAIESGQRHIVGVNCAIDDAEDVAIEVFAADPAAERRQVERLERLRSERDSDRVTSALEDLERAAREGTNVVPATLAAIRSLATVGEVSSVFQRVHGPYVPGVS
jgi:methylmalonyl-CoA mutase N-terminal domain/subunit